MMTSKDPTCNTIRFPSKTNCLSWLKSAGLEFPSIVDVGTHNETRELRLAFPTARHILFEPACEFFEGVQKNYSGMNYKLVPVAVSDVDGKSALRKVCITGDEVSHSSLCSSASQEDNVSNVETVRLDSFFTRNPEEAPFLLKVDVDGYEIPILRGAEGIWGKIGCIIIEVTADTFAERINYITTRGFRVFDIIDQCYYAGVFSQADFVFISEEIYFTHDKLRPWQTQSFSWDKWTPVASYEPLIK